MTAMVHEPLMREDDLLAGFLALKTPEGYRAELIDGEIVVTPPPGGPHEEWIAEITWQLARHSAAKFHCSGNKGLIIPGGPGQRENRVIPDGTVVRADLGLLRDAGPWMPVEPDTVSMVMEVTSRRGDLDRQAKRHGYARAGIPLYLLVDRDKGRVSLFSEPEDGDYKHTHRVPFGEKLALPKPFDFDLDTSDFG
ncbi:Uma2 family endonuclease [Actinomadura sp. WAC 06369]|uniref:Uma2 family endonuclease n=1 Tax=Actinomadura sp. WAC 06369 TaxID=2203193 RepID=UPI0018F304EE|nr:Uma2 family endonuclease [Actinomadura sp. WAC 06369]